MILQGAMKASTWASTRARIKLIPFFLLVTWDVKAPAKNLDKARPLAHAAIPDDKARRALLNCNRDNAKSSFSSIPTRHAVLSQPYANLEACK